MIMYGQVSNNRTTTSRRMVEEVVESSPTYYHPSSTSSIGVGGNSLSIEYLVIQILLKDTTSTLSSSTMSSLSMVSSSSGCNMKALPPFPILYSRLYRRLPSL